MKRLDDRLRAREPSTQSTRTLTSIRSHAGRLATEFMAAKSMSEDLKRENEEQRQEIRRLEAERSATLAQHAALKSALESGKRERRELLAKQQELEDIVDEIRKNQARAGELLEESKGNYDVSSKLVEDRLANDKGVLERMKDMTTEVERLKTHNRKLSSDLGDLHLKFDAANDELADTKKRLRESTTNLSEAQSELQAAIDSVKQRDEQMKALERAQTELEENMKKLHEEKLRISSNQLDAEKEKNRAAMTQIAVWEEKNAELERRIAGVKRDLERKSRDHDALKLSFPTMASEIENLRSKGKQLEARINDAALLINKLNTQLDGKSEDLMRVREEMTGAKQELESLRGELSLTAAQRDAQLEQIEAQRVEMEALKKRSLDERREMEAAHEAAKKLQEVGVSAQMEKQIEVIHKRNKEWMDKKDDEHASALAEKDLEIDSLRKSLDELRSGLVQEPSSHQGIEIAEPSIPLARKRKVAAQRRSDAVPTPSLIDKQRSRSRPRVSMKASDFREAPRDDHAPEPTTEPIWGAPSPKKKAKPARRKTKKDLKSELRAFAMANAESDEDNDFDPFAFDE